MTAARLPLVAGLGLCLLGCQVIVGIDDVVLDSALADLEVSHGVLEPPFSPDVLSYSLAVPLSAEELVVTPTAVAGAEGLTIEVAGSPTISSSPSPAVPLNFGPSTVDVVVDPDRGSPRTYAIEVHRGQGTWQQAFLKASNPGEQDDFGRAVALDGDTLAVGAPGEDSSATGIDGDQTSNAASDSGAVYVFLRSDGVWAQQAYIKASTTDLAAPPAPGDNFGSSLALSGDTLVVGAPNEGSAANTVNGDESDNSAFAAGAVYVFTRSGGIWSQQAYIKASNAEGYDRFGASVAVSGDVLAVGAPSEDSASSGIDGAQGIDDYLTGPEYWDPSRGAVYIFERTDNTWAQSHFLKASNTHDGMGFGESLALDGDTLAVGAPFEDSAGLGVGGEQTELTAPDSGAVYVFRRDPQGDWAQQAYVKASTLMEQFGLDVGLSADTLAVGSHSKMRGIFRRTGGAWSEEAVASTSVGGIPRLVATWGELVVVTGGSGEGRHVVLALLDELWRGVSSGGPRLSSSKDLAISGTTWVAGEFDDSDSGILHPGPLDGEPINDAAPASGAVFVYQ